ncbi:hypothetical protein HDU92_006806 [Lobulomyces angularis]|nr:hypothetical protein HDU92_006806 [Lobulomyces angularis]
MSFNNPLGVNSSADSTSTIDSAFQFDKCSKALFTISNNIQQLVQTSQSINTPKDSHSTRESLLALQEETKELIKLTSEDLKVVLSLDSDEISIKTKKKKLEKDFKNIAKRFQQVSKVVTEKCRDSLKTAKEINELTLRVELEEEENEGVPLLAESNSKKKLVELKQMDNQIDYNENLIQEREQDLRQIESSMLEVNEIFRDLGTLVHEQGHMLDNIENNVDSVAINMENATGELRTANEYHKKARRRAFCLTVVLAIIGFVKHMDKDITAPLIPRKVGKPVAFENLTVSAVQKTKATFANLSSFLSKRVETEAKYSKLKVSFDDTVNRINLINVVDRKGTSPSILTKAEIEEFKFFLVQMRLGNTIEREKKVSKKL